MTKKELTANLLLLLTAAIWGFAFVAQKTGAEYVGAFTFNGIRFLIGGLILRPVIAVLDASRKKSGAPAASRKEPLRAGLIAGLLLFAGASLQQIGILYTTAGKAGFITGLYVVLVPVFGFFLRQRTGKNVWAAVVLAAVGIFLLSVTEAFTVSGGDLLVMVSAVFFACHILCIDRHTAHVDPLRLSSIQFLVTGTLSLLIAVLFEDFTGLYAALPMILYGGLLSVGVAYTLQVVAQKNARPAHAAILLSMESVFGALGGALILRERMTARGYIGCALVFAAILLSQIRPKETVRR
ncbi:MAG: DMT family transporter [Eubacteriales bacterium]|jgi:drug/metabolite transporter (DMT)-like permease